VKLETSLALRSFSDHQRRHHDTRQGPKLFVACKGTN
jgi:hypothetical protein